MNIKQLDCRQVTGVFNSLIYTCIGAKAVNIAVKRTRQKASADQQRNVFDFSSDVSDVSDTQKIVSFREYLFLTCSLFSSLLSNG